MVNVTTCPNDYLGAPYALPRTTEAVHDWNRFGRTNNLSGVIAGTEPTRDYVTGLLIITIFLCSVFGTWMIVLLVLKCLGEKRVGFLSGSALEDSGGKTKCSLPSVLRFVAVFSSLYVIGVSISLAVTFEKTAVTALDQVIDTSTFINVQAGKVNGYSTNLLQSTAPLSQIAADLKNKTIGGLCPGKIIPTPSGSDFNDVLKNFEERLDATIEVVRGSITHFKDTSAQIVSKTAKANETLDDYKKFKWIMFVWSLPMIVFASIYLIGIIVAWLGKSNKVFDCVLSWINMPLFILFIIIGWVVCCVFSILGMGSADFCTGGASKSPSGTALDIFESIKTNSDAKDMIRKVISYYTSGCRGCPFEFFNSFLTNIDSSISKVTTFVNDFDNVGVDALAQQCPTRSKAEIQSIYDTMAASLSKLKQINGDVRGIISSILEPLSCKSIHTLWANAVEHALCDKAVDLFHTGFWCGLFATLFGLTLVTLRATYLKIKKT